MGLEPGQHVGARWRAGLQEVGEGADDGEMIDLLVELEPIGARAACQAAASRSLLRGVTSRSAVPCNSSAGGSGAVAWLIGWIAASSASSKMSRSQR